ncbi:TPA: hypothetical protein DCQ44_00870 [Candidatus Taylorbacteria bacterium]|nr:hypothetical protein [Candidatus Taylorbacteria bacterium]
MNKNKILLGLILFVTSGLVFASIYAMVQHVLRMDGYDPQIQYAEGTARVLSTGADPMALVPNSSIDISKDLDVFASVYDDQGKIVVSNGMLNNTRPSIPAGVLDYTRVHGQNRLTWQPANGVRIAAVVQRYSSTTTAGFVLMGRSLREVENRSMDILEMAALGWVGSLVFIGLFVYFI